MTRHFVTDVPTGTTTEDPANANQVSTESLEHAARQLEEAQQTSAAISSWLQAACAHSQRGNHAGVVQSVTRAAHLSGDKTFAPFVTKKSTGDTAADASAVTGPIERVGDASDGPIEPPIERVGDRPAPDANRPASNTAAAERL